MKMNRKAIAAIAAVVVAVAAIGIVYAITDDQYDITYVLNGGTQNDLNPTSYEAGTTTELYDPYDDDMVFVSWYLDEALTTPVVSIGPEITGDITLYAGWSDSVVGKALEYDVSGSYDSGLLSSYRMDGTVTYRYLYQNDSGEYLMSTQTDMEYMFLTTTQHRSSEDTYWTGDSDTKWYDMGTETIDTINGPKECQVIQGTHSDGSIEKQWIGDGWITYRIEYSSQGMFSSTDLVYELKDVYTVETSSEVQVTAYADMGIEVSGDGTYRPGDSVTLTASVVDGTTFSGWYDSSGNLVSTSLEYTFTAQYGNFEFYAMNTSDPDVSTMTGTALDLGSYTETTEWTVYDQDGDSVASFTGDPAQYSFDTPGEYTIMGVDPDDGTHRTLTLMVDGYTTVQYEWSVDGESYTYSLDILYSDVVYYRDYYDVSQRQQDIYNDHQRDRTFVTYKDKYIQQVATDFGTMTEGMTDLERVNFLLAFSQCLGYEDDSVYMGYEEYWKFPLETLYDHGGDCEDTSILLASLAEAMGYDTALLLFPGHMAAGIHIDGDYPDLGGFYLRSDPDKVYYYCETTSTGFTVGQIPSSVDTENTTMVVI